MIRIMLEGFLLGLVLSAFIGPVFFVLLEISLSRGVKEAIAFDFGALLSDVIWILLCYFGATKLLAFMVENEYLNLIGALVFIGFGMGIIKKRNTGRRIPEVSSANSLGKRTLSGFMLNTLNPSVAVFWMGTVSVVLTQFGAKQKDVLLFFLCMMVTVILTDLLKIMGARKLKKLLDPQNTEKWLSRAAGLGMMVFGTVLLIKFLYHEVYG